MFVNNLAIVSEVDWKGTETGRCGTNSRCGERHTMK
ncbi:hypothetical protein A2U01_0077923, partial [Trifolium medium]|nr:hypothetical protein [Trifolium medium]